MHNVMDMIEIYDLPLDSPIGVVQTYNDRARNGKYDYGTVLRSIVGDNYQELEDPDHARIQVGYVFQIAATAYRDGKSIDADQLYTEATKKAREFISEMPWVFAKKDVEEKLDENGRAKPKKGSKGQRSYEVYCELVTKDATRKEIMEAFQDEKVMGMQPHTKSGASTYYYNMKAKYEKENG